MELAIQLKDVSEPETVSRFPYTKKAYSLKRIRQTEYTCYYKILTSRKVIRKSRFK